MGVALFGHAPFVRGGGRGAVPGDEDVLRLELKRGTSHTVQTNPQSIELSDLKRNWPNPPPLPLPRFEHLTPESPDGKDSPGRHKTRQRQQHRILQRSRLHRRIRQVSHDLAPVFPAFPEATEFWIGGIPRIGLVR